MDLRRFDFFNLNKNIDEGALSSALKGTKLSVATSGPQGFVFGDTDGNIIILNKNYEAKFFKAYNVSITHAEHLKHSPFLVTIGNDEPGINPILKVWNIDLLDKTGTPRCARLVRLLANHKAVQVSALTVHESGTLLAVGFQNGCILLLRGDVVRDKAGKLKMLKECGSSLVTGLAFRTTAVASYLFVTTETSVSLYDVTAKDKEFKSRLDEWGCSPCCSTMAELPHEAHFVVARSDAIYCYTTDGRGPCHAIDKEKAMIKWSKSFLVIVSKESKSTPGHSLNTNNFTGEPVANDITLFDMQNSLIVHSSIMSTPIVTVLVEWGSFYIITEDLKIHQLAEKDVQSKLTLLFKKNLYDVAIRIARSQHYDEDGLTDIYRQYGDHLNSKGDRAGAIEQYIKTIGKLEPSYIIRKFMDSSHMEQLMDYLQALHRKGFATGDHTTLLLNCFTKLGKDTELKDFIMTKGKKVDFDIDIALKVVRDVSPEDALILAKSHHKHIWVLRILIENQKRYQDAINYISKLDFLDAEKSILDFGNVLMDHVPSETTLLLKGFCTKREWDNKDTRGNNSWQQRFIPRPQDFLHLFLLKSEFLVEFLEHLIAARNDWNVQIYNALVEHYLVVWSKSLENNRNLLEQQLVELLQNPNASYDRDHTFLLCQMYDFTPGLIHLYEEKKMYHQVVQIQLETKNWTGLLSSCRRFGHQDPNTWVQALWLVAQTPDTPQHILSEILSTIEKEKLLSPQMTMAALGSSNGSTTVGQARKYLSAVLKAEEELVAQEIALIEKYSEETKRIRSHLHTIESSTVIFQASRCTICNRQLELPSIHFLCQHSYHQHCFQSYSDNESECIACRKNNKVLVDMIKSQENSHELHEAFHSQLEKSDDGFSIVSDYFAKGVFKKAPPAQPSNTVPSIPTAAPEAIKMPLLTHHEESAKTIPKAQPMRRNPVVQSNADLITDNIASSLPSTSRALEVPLTTSNPFDIDEQEGDGDYDDAKNPFADEINNESTNPFSDDEYDESLNPFS